MSPVLGALPPKLRLTASNYYNEWLNFLDEKPTVIKCQQLNLPELSMCIVGPLDVNWLLVNGETSVSGRSVGHSELDVVDDIEGLLLPPKNQFAINLFIERIERGRPSLCDEVES